MTGPLEGVELLIRYASPECQKEFRRLLMTRGIMRPARDGREAEINQGRERDYCSAFAHHFVRDWRGDIRPPQAPYDADKMGAVLFSVTSAVNYLHEQIGNEPLFFPREDRD